MNNLDKTLTKYPFLFLNDNNTKLFEKIQKKNINLSVDPDNEENDCFLLKEIFLSDENITKIQKKIQKNVFQKKKITIPYQKKESVKVVMKYIYQEYGKDLPYNIKEQIDELNSLVVKELTPHIINNLISYYKYIRDINKKQTLLDLPQNVSTKGANIIGSLEQ